MEIQDQIYVIAGVSGGIFLLLFVFIGYLMYRVAKITELLMGRQMEKRDTYAYNNPTIVPGEELNRRGFQMHSGSAPSSINRDPVVAPVQSAAGLPRLEPNYNERNQAQNDFSSVLDNSEIVFGGDRPSNLMNRNRPQQPRSSQLQNFRPALANDNYAYPQNGGDGTGQPKNYLNERMHY